MRCLKRRLSDVVFRALLDDLEAAEQPQDDDGPSSLPPDQAAPEDVAAAASQTVR